MFLFTSIISILSSYLCIPIFSYTADCKRKHTHTPVGHGTQHAAAGQNWLPWAAALNGKSANQNRHDFIELRAQDSD